MCACVRVHSQGQSHGASGLGLPLTRGRSVPWDSGGGGDLVSSPSLGPLPNIPFRGESLLCVGDGPLLGPERSSLRLWEDSERLGQVQGTMMPAGTSVWVRKS